MRSSSRLMKLASVLLAMLLYIPISKAQHTDTLNFLGNKDYPPYQMIDSKTGEPTGFSVDIFRAIAKTMGLHYKITLTDWTYARNELEMQRVDGLIAMSYSRTRSQKVRFTVPYAYIAHSLFTRKPSNFNSLQEMKGKEIIVVKGDIMHDYLRETQIASVIIPVTDYRKALRLLAQGKYDGALLSRYQGLYTINEYNLTNVGTAGDVFESKEVAIAVNSAHPELTPLLNEGLQIIKSTGEYQALVEKWFGIYEEQKLKDILFPMAWYILVPLLAVFMLIFGWSWTLRRKVATRTQQLRSELERRLQAEKELIQEKSILKSLINSIPDLIFYKNNKNKYMGSNKSFAHFMGVKPGEVVGKDDYALFPLADAERYNILDSKLMKEDKSAKMEMWSSDAKNNYHLLEIVKVPFHDDMGKVLGLVGICHDVTTRHKTQQSLRIAKQKAEESDKLKSAFLANMSHEIRTPMNAIIGFAELLGDKEINDDLREELLTHINQNSSFLLHLIDDIIDLAKIEANELTIKAKRVEIAQVMDEIFSSTHDLLTPDKEKHIKFRLEHPTPSTSITTYTDPMRLKQVIQNLVDNAFKYTDKGEIVLRYNLQRDKTIRFEVQDTGVGIPPEKHESIFERFNKLEVNKTKIFRGTGLGLAICKNLVKRMGGSIGVNSMPGKGSTFYFTLPHLLIQKQDMQTTEPKHRAPKNGSSAKILIVEDELSSYKYLQMLLKREGYQTLRAETGIEAIATVQMHRDIRLILMDIKLPDMDGLTATREIKRLYPEVPIIAQTAFAMTNDETSSREAGCDDYLKKPIRRDMLLETINKWLFEEKSE
jgi:two-component system sensor histidine kinase EvgS